MIRWAVFSITDKGKGRRNDMRSVGGGGECRGKQGRPWLGIGCQSASNITINILIFTGAAQSQMKEHVGPSPVCASSHTPPCFTSSRVQEWGGGLKDTLENGMSRWWNNTVVISPTQAFQGTPCLKAAYFPPLVSAVLCCNCTVFSWGERSLSHPSLFTSIEK